MQGLVDSKKLGVLMNLIDDKIKSHLVNLKIMGNLLDSASVKLLVEELNVKFKSLQVLNLSYNDIGDDGAIN